MQWLSDLTTAAASTLWEEPGAAHARDYLAERGVDEALARAHGVGWAQVETVPVRQGTKAFAEWFPRYFYRRLVFPLRDFEGVPMGLVTRPLPAEDQPQRVYQQFYARPSEVYPFLFGLAEALPTIWERRTAIVVEGIFDYFAVRAAGHPNVVALLTAHPSKTALRLFRRVLTHLIILTDMDDAGRFAAYRMAGLEPPREVWPENWTPTRLTPPPYRVSLPRLPAPWKDPGQLLERGHVATLKGILDKINPPPV